MCVAAICNAVMCSTTQRDECLYTHQSLNCIQFEGLIRNLVSKCSATLASLAAAPPGARQGFGGPNYRRHPSQVAVLQPPHLPRAKMSAPGGSGMGCNRPFGRVRTPLRHINSGKSRDGGSYTLDQGISEYGLKSD